MCVPACQERIVGNLSRRKFLHTAALGTAAGGAGAAVAAGREVSVNLPSGGFGRVIDLTHPLDRRFPTFSGSKTFQLKMLKSFSAYGYNLAKWVLEEHTGTHLDAPFHFSDEATADEIAVENLVGPLAVIDIREHARSSPDAKLTGEDLEQWEKAHGRLPDGGIVAAWSGWDAYVNTKRFRNADRSRTMHFPGFGISAAEFLLSERRIKGIMVDTLSLDPGNSQDFDVHYRWLGSNRWGIECAANLGELPPKGSYVVVGGPKVVGATGGPSRVIAFAP